MLRTKFWRCSTLLIPLFTPHFIGSAPTTTAYFHREFTWLIYRIKSITQTIIAMRFCISHVSLNHLLFRQKRPGLAHTILASRLFLVRKFTTLASFFFILFWTNSKLLSAFG